MEHFWTYGTLLDGEEVMASLSQCHFATSRFLVALPLRSFTDSDLQARFPRTRKPCSAKDSHKPGLQSPITSRRWMQYELRRTACIIVPFLDPTQDSQANIKKAAEGVQSRVQAKSSELRQAQETFAAAEVRFPMLASPCCLLFTLHGLELVRQH
eukprot:5495036-Amphidinium_carterae.1